MRNIAPDTKIKLNNGVDMPVFGFSTEEIGTRAFNEITQTELFLEAIEAGFRYFDAPEVYGGLYALGNAIRRSGIPREEFFIAPKMRSDELGDGRFRQSLEETLAQLQMDYVDLYSTHWPVVAPTDYPHHITYIDGIVGCAREKTDKRDADGVLQMYEAGMCRAYGMCNMEAHHIKAILEHPRCTAKPALVQNHFSPLFQNVEVRRLCEENGILFGGLFEKDQTVKQTKPLLFTDVGRSSLLWPDNDDAKMANNMIRMSSWRRNDETFSSPHDKSKNPRREKAFFDDCEAITAIAKKHGKTNNNVLARWSLQQGLITIVKAFRVEHIKSEFDVFDFELDNEDMQKMAGFDIGMRFGYHPDYIDF